MSKIFGNVKEYHSDVIYRKYKRQEVLVMNKTGTKKLFSYFIITTLEPYPHRCVCNFCGANPLAHFTNDEGFTIVGHSCLNKGCKICGSYDKRPEART